MDAKGNYIYAVDFDGTLSLGKWPDVGDPNLSLFEFLKWNKENGTRIILNTCRTGELLEDAVEYCSNLGLEFDAVNENLPELIELYGNDCRKISADFYIDDKAINSNQALWGPILELQKAAKKFEEERKNVER